MPIIGHPLDIGADDLLRGVEFTFCGDIYVLCKRFLRKEWLQKYVIISQGCLYIYSSRKAKKPDQSYSFKDFESARESDPVNGENICFCLSDKTAQRPILLSCDTNENRTKWIHLFNTAISEVRGTYYSADSGFGSAETVPNSRQRPHGETEDSDMKYDEVDDRLFRRTNVADDVIVVPRVPVQQCDDGGDYEEPTCMGGASNSNLYVNNVITGTHENNRAAVKKDKLPKLPMKPSTKPKTKPLPLPKPTANRLSTPSDDSIFSSKNPTSLFCSVREGASSSIQESNSHLSVSGGESLYENNESDSSADSGNTSPKVIYENPETLIKKFRKDEYFCENKGVGKKLLKKKEVGYFAVFPADEFPEIALCVMTPEGLKYFRIHSQDDQVSLYKQHKMNTFASLDELLTYYSINDLPSEEYKVKLQNGYNSVV